jgi:hypothetical protein
MSRLAGLSLDEPIKSVWTMGSEDGYSEDMNINRLMNELPHQKSI